MQTCKKCQKEFSFQNRIELATNVNIPDYHVEYYKKQLFSDFCSNCSFLLTDLAIEKQRLEYLTSTLGQLAHEKQYYLAQKKETGKNINNLQWDYACLPEEDDNEEEKSHK
jgi:hypothetical protein